jgi:hypothetical protein
MWNCIYCVTIWITFNMISLYSKHIVIHVWSFKMGYIKTLNQRQTIVSTTKYIVDRNKSIVYIKKASFNAIMPVFDCHCCLGWWNFHIYLHSDLDHLWSFLRCLLYLLLECNICNWLIESDILIANSNVLRVMREHATYYYDMKYSV